MAMLPITTANQVVASRRHHLPSAPLQRRHRAPATTLLVPRRATTTRSSNGPHTRSQTLLHVLLATPIGIVQMKSCKQVQTRMPGRPTTAQSPLQPASSAYMLEATTNIAEAAQGPLRARRRRGYHRGGRAAGRCPLFHHSSSSSTSNRSKYRRSWAKACRHRHHHHRRMASSSRPSTGCRTHGPSRPTPPSSIPHPHHLCRILRRITLPCHTRQRSRPSRHLRCRRWTTVTLAAQH